MTIFNEYSKYYDLLYKDKDYVRESEYILSLIEKYHSSATSILDLGCGTGNHLACFLKKGYKSLCGVDVSESMIKIAQEKHSEILFHCKDIAMFRLQQKFDVVTSLFHVISYQTTNERLYASFKTAYEQLNEGGLFLFDCWYGPAVLTDQPAVRIKHLEDEQTNVIRLSEPIIHPNENIVDVNFSIIIINKQDSKASTLNEKHKLRYLFKPEVEFLLNDTGFRLLECVSFMNNKEPGLDSWNVLFIAQK